MPFAAAAPPALVVALNAEPGLDAVVAVDPGRRRQPLLAAYPLRGLASRAQAVPVPMPAMSPIRCER